MIIHKRIEIRLLEGTGDYGFSLQYHGSDTNLFKIMARNNGVATTALTIARGTSNVGIGTTSPGQKLQVNGTIAAVAGDAGYGLHLTSTGSNIDANDSVYLGFSHGSVVTDGNVRASIGLNVKSGGNGRLVFKTGPPATQTEKMRIDDVGNVGIGTNNPSQKLHVNGNAQLTGALFQNYKTGSATYNGDTTQGDMQGWHSEYDFFRMSGTGDSGDINGISFGMSIEGNDKITPQGVVNFKLNGGGANAANSWGAIPNNTVMTLVGNGKVGIGDTTPGLPLVVKGHVAAATSGDAPLGGETDTTYYRSGSNNLSSTSSYRWFHGNRNDIGTTSEGFTPFGNWRFTAFFEYGIFAGGIIVSSDERIKTEITDFSDSYALELVRNIPCRDYHYKDIEARQPEKTIGFIAQEVREVFPSAVKLITNYIPDQQRTFDNLIWEEIQEGNQTKYLLTITDYTVENGTKVKFSCSDNFNPDIDYSAEDNTEQVITEEVISVKREDGKFLFDKTWNYVAVVAKEVHDFHSLDKQKIFALHHPAIQELDRQQQADKARIAELETKNQELETKNQALETKVQTMEQQLADLLARVSALEN